MSSNNNNQINVPEAKEAMNRFKMECANEVAFQNHIKATPHNSRRTPCQHIIPSDCPKISPHTSVCELII